MQEFEQATERPWSLEIAKQHGESFDSVWIRAHGEHADALNEDNMTVAALTHRRNAQANAHLIVTAVNQFDALREVERALRDVLPFIQRIRSSPLDGGNKVADEILNTLASLDSVRGKVER